MKSKHSFPGPVARALLMVALLPLTAVVAAAVTRDFQAAWVNSSGSTTIAHYRIYAPSPADAERVKGVVFFYPGTGGDWRFRVDSVVWQEAARSLDFALISAAGSTAGYFTKPEDETRRMLDAILGGAADALGRPELVNAPIAVTGFSLGGWTSTDLRNKIPDRVITAIPQHGGRVLDTPDRAAARKVPLLYIPGSADTNPATNGQISAANFVTYRGSSEPNGLAAFAVDWLTPHEPFLNQSWALAWTWIAEIVALRYPPGELPSLEPGNPLRLLDLAEADGWLGQRAYVTSTTGADRSPFVPIAPRASYTGDKTTASWLPNETVARAYRALNSYDGDARTVIPRQGPLTIVGDAAPGAVVESDQIDLPQLTVWPVGSTITLRLDPREFDDVRPIVSVEFHDGATHLGTLTAQGPDGWSVTRQLTTRGIRSFTVVATDSAGNKSSAFRAVVVAAPHAIPERPLLQFEFNETGAQAVATGAKPVTATFVNAAGAPADLHGEAGGGVSGRAHDRAFDNRASTGMGSAGVGGGLPVGNIRALDGLTSFTLQGWFKTDVAINGAARIFEKNFGSGVTGILLRTGTSPGQLALQVNNRAVASAASYGATGQWVFFAVTYDALKSTNNVGFFVGSASAPVASAGVYTLDGGSVVSNTVRPNAIPLVIGNNSGTAGFANDRPFDGLLDNLRIFGAASGSRGLLTLEQLELIRRCDLRGEELPVPSLSPGENQDAPSLGFMSAVGRSYQLQRSLSLEAGVWTPAGPVWEGAGGELRLGDRAPVASDRVFYRLLVTP